MAADKEAKGNIQKPYNFDPQLQAGLNEVMSPMGISELVTGLQEIINLIIVQSNIYALQKGRNFTVNNKELKYYMWIN